MTKNIDDKKQQLEKERLREALADKAKPRCTICGKYTDKKTSPQCFGHGGGAGGGGSGSSETKGSDAASTHTKTSSQSESKNPIEATIAITSSIAAIPQFDSHDIKFNPEVISELLSKKLLMIDNDRDKGVLTIKLQCDPNLLSQEQKDELKRYVNAILKELNELKKEKGISADCYTLQKDKDENILSLRISLPNPTLYDEFIQRLANRNLLPQQNIAQHKNEKVTYPEDGNHFKPTPFSNKPTPDNKKSKEELIQNQGEKKSGIKPKSPLDGFKPKGFE